ncbi:methyl-accepting chemotaxis protein [Ideonella margarita]|uniref:Methyl-accepting chemotaxis protein n=1 Tax=Ideonella margarita TaxID=2984191 RepID=A0ABU9C8T4_9BURK
MIWLWKFRIGTRLAMAFGAMIVLLLAICAYGVQNTRSLARDLEATATVDLARLGHAHALDKNASVVAQSARELLLLDAAGPIKKQRELINRTLADTDTQFTALQALGGDGDLPALVSEVDTTRKAFVKAIASYLDILENGSPDDARRALLVELRPVQGAYEKALLAMTTAVQGNAASRAEAGHQMAASDSLKMMVLGGVAVVLAIAAALVITRSIALPLSRAIAAARSIREGHLSYRIDVRTQDEVGEVLTAIGEMQTHLTGVIESVHHAARDVAISTEEIAQGNADLSNRTERASSNLQETASAMSGMAQTVADGSLKSREASDVANRARNAVVEGGQAVESLVDTMTRIADSSNRIKDIIGVIDGIAFQTNILALNAAVEAARAGEHGRGFAVVASEVRTLAARAAAAAKEIKGLIDDSAQKVASGNQTVTEVGQRIRGIVTEVVSVRELIEAVSSSGHHQEAGIGQINQRVADLDQTTQQNAALVEQLAATTESLKSHANRLVSTVEFFRIDNTPRAALAAPV